jgi:hypothetical protein
MITLEAPHMAINSVDFSCRYQMWNTWDGITSAEPREHIIAWTAAVARGAPGGKLKNLVINSHGSPAHLIIGQGFDRSNVRLFQDWAGLIDKIWLNACSIGLVSGTRAADGNISCTKWPRLQNATSLLLPKSKARAEIGSIRNQACDRA